MTEKMGNASSANWEKTFELIKTKHDLAFVAIDEAISLEEKEKPNEAIEKYKQGIQLIDEALNVQVSCPENPNITWEKACVMIQKIKKTRAEVLMRINSIQSSPTFVPEEDPPSYDEAVSSSTDEDVPRTYRDLASALNDLSLDPNVQMEEEVIYTHENVRIYFISANGEVLSTKEPQTLKISMVEGNEANAPKAILQVGTWVYPLVPGVSPCFRTDYGAFILPDVYSSTPGSSVGIILPPDADAEVYDILENILHGIISQETGKLITHPEVRGELPEDTSTKISNVLINGAWYLSQGLIKGAEKAGELISYGTPKLISHLKGAEQPKHVPRKLSKTIQIAETTTSKAAEVTGFVAEKVGEATVKLGQFLAPHIQRQGTKLLTGFNMTEQQASERMNGILTVAAGAVEGFSTVYRGLETSAAILGSNLKENTVKVVQHKYGVRAGEATDGTLATVGNVYNISRNSHIITPKGFAKKAGKNMGKGIVRGYAEMHHNNTHPHLNAPSTSHNGLGAPGTSRTENVEKVKPLKAATDYEDLSPTDEKKNFQNF